MSNTDERLRACVWKAYSSIADSPEDKHPVPVGRLFAKSIGYPEKLLDSLPSVAIDAFTGVSNVSIFADIKTGSTVLDMGCGAGVDSLIAAQKVGPTGRVIGIDFSIAMISRARQALDESGLDNVEFRLAAAENIPLEDGIIDVVLVNGIFNLNPARDTIFSELARVVRQDGAVYAAEIILREPLSSKVKCDIDNWFA